MSRTTLVDPAEEKPYVSQLEEDYYERWVPSRRKLLLLASLPLALVPLMGSMYFLATVPIQQEFKAGSTEVALTLSLFSLTAGVAPLFYGPLADRFGRKPSFIFSLGVTLGSCLMAAGSWNIWMLVAFRVLMAIGVSGLAVVSMGTVADIYPRQTRGNAMALMVLPSLAAPIIGPVIGGALIEYVGWRSIFYLIALLTAPLLVAFMIAPETKRPSKKSDPFNPFLPLKFMFNGPIGLTGLCRSFEFTATYLVAWSLPILTERYFDQGPLTTGLLQLPYGISTLVGSLMAGKFTDYCGRRWGTGGRLIPFHISVAATIVGALVYGFTFEPVEWLAVAFTTLVGWGVTFGRPGVYTFQIEQSPANASAISACDNSIRFGIIFVMVSVAPALLDQYGSGVLMSLISIFCFLSLLPSMYIQFTTPNVPADKTIQ